jgi:hypothetical protein
MALNYGAQQEYCRAATPSKMQLQKTGIVDMMIVKVLWDLIFSINPLLKSAND